jgi:hypothetical protein
VSRLSALAAHPRRTVAALAVVLAAVGITVGSGANFTASAANPANTFTAGTLNIGSSTSSALFNATNLRPGDTVTGSVDIQNTGSLSGAFTLGTSSANDPNGLLGQLDLKVEDCGVFSGSTAPTCTGSNIVYTGKANAVPAAVSLGTFAGGAKHRYQFGVGLDSTADNNYQGDSSTVTFTWNAA